MIDQSHGGLPPALASALDAKGYDTLTEVQEAMLAPELLGQDLLVSAQTGSGKTVGFGIAISSDLLAGENALPRAGVPLALVVAPTRELAVQVATEFRWLFGEAGARVATCIGGMDIRSERQALARGAHVVVGTPGRLVDHISRGAFDTSELRAVVLDEADEMLNMGFREELESILDACPEERRTLMFSATVSPGISKLAQRYQRDAVRVTATGESRQHSDITYRALITAGHDTERAIINTLRFYEARNAIVFCATRAAVARLTSRLANRGLSVVSMSGELSQAERTNALQAMRDGRARVCVATDVAARGIDLPGLELVIHADLPKNREGLLHRSGRTGRAGSKGTSVLIVPPRARRRIEFLFRDAKVDAEWGSPPSADEVLEKDNERLLGHWAFGDDIEVSDLARDIAAVHSPEKVAEALVRMFSKDHSAPEELSEVRPDRERPEKRERAPRDEFEDSVWVTLSVGRTNRAEPRWLLPMLCKAGKLKKEAIGAIRIREDETYVQLDAEGASAFLELMANGGSLEKGVEVQRADGPPPQEEKKPFRPKKNFDRRDDRGDKKPFKKPFKAKRHEGGEDRKPEPWSPDAGEVPDTFKRKPKAKDKPQGKPGGKPGNWKKKPQPADGKGPRKRKDKKG